MAERFVESFPSRIISDSRKEVVDHDQHVPARFWSFTLVAGRRVMSVNRYVVSCRVVSCVCAAASKTGRAAAKSKTIPFILFLS